MLEQKVRSKDWESIERLAGQEVVARTESPAERLAVMLAKESVAVLAMG